MRFFDVFHGYPKNPKTGVLGVPPPPPPKKGVLGGGLILRETAHGVVMEGGVNPHFWPFLAIFDPFFGGGLKPAIFGPPKKRKKT